MNKKVMLISLVYFIISTTVVFYFVPYQFSEFEEGINYYLPFFSSINIVLFLMLTHGVNNSWIRFEVLFLLGYIIVNFQIPFAASIGIQPEDPYFIWINKSVVNFATWMSATAVHLWIIGYLSVILFRRKFIKHTFQGSKKYMPVMDICIFLLFLTFIGLVGKEFLGGHYAGTSNWGPGATYAFLFLNSVLFLRIIYFFRDAALRSNRKSFSYLLNCARRSPILSGVVIVYLPLFLLIGDRGPVAQVAMLILGAYSIYFKRISFAYFSSILIIGAVVFTIVGIGRGIGISGESVLTKGYDRFNESEEMNPTYELASAVRLQYRSLSVVPRYHPHLFGGTVALNLVSIVPFLGGRIVSFFNIPEMYYSSAMFFTIISQGPNYTWGEGTTVLADLHLNFGVYGSFVVFFLFGMFMSNINLNCQLTRSDVSVIMYLAFLIFAIYLNRSTLFFPLKIMCYMILLNAIIPSKKISYA